MRVARLPEHEVRDECEGQGPLWVTIGRGLGRRVEVNAKNYLGCGQNAYAWPAVRAQLDRERSVKNLLEQVTLVHGGRGTNA